MSAAKHTPGPWSTVRTVGGSLQIRPADKRRGPVATLTDENALERGEWSQKDYANAETNARLIAAAPELLAALRSMVNFGNLGAYERAEAMRAARAAIAKATGAQS